VSSLIYSRPNLTAPDGLSANRPPPGRCNLQVTAFLEINKKNPIVFAGNIGHAYAYLIVNRAAA